MTTRPLPPTLHWPSARILLPGGAGFLGRHIAQALHNRGVPADSILAPRSRDHDLRDPAQARALLADSFGGQGPTLIINCAGYVGGIGLNRAEPARMFHDNLIIGANLIDAASGDFARREGRFVQIGTMCSYPAAAPLPYHEDSLFTGRPDPEIAPYGLAKLALLEMLRAYHAQHGLRSAYVIPVNLYGPGDNIADPGRSHAAGALIRRFCDAADQYAPEVVCWGTGSPIRDFLYIEDAAEGVLAAAERITDATPINLGSGHPTTIRALAEAIARLSGFTGRIEWDHSKGDGVSRRVLDVTRARELLGFEAQIGLEEGLAATVAWYRSTLPRA